MRFNPRATVKGQAGSIMAREFDVSFFKQFTIVMNALDNVGTCVRFVLALVTLTLCVLYAF